MPIEETVCGTRSLSHKIFTVLMMVKLKLITAHFGRQYVLTSFKLPDQTRDAFMKYTENVSGFFMFTFYQRVVRLSLK